MSTKPKIKVPSQPAGPYPAIAEFIGEYYAAALGLTVAKQPSDGMDP